MTFSTLNLSEDLLRAVKDQGYSTPTPIQAKAIPVILKGHDLLASAQTGTGKTASFVLPLLQYLSNEPKAKNNRAKVLILAPTRELAAQIHDDIINYGKYLRIRSAVIYGGVKINPQMMKLRAGVEILVATPGRLLDLYNQNAVHFDQINTFVLDEADRMLDMGFIHDIKRIMALLPKKRQTLLFSATFSKEIKQLAKDFLNNPMEVNIAPHQMTAVLVKHLLHPVDKGRKSELLSHLIRNNQWEKALVFTRTKHGANKLAKILLSEGIESAAIHGNKSQAQRTKALADFKQDKIQVLVATDIAARGIDIDQLPIVVNFDLPHVPEDYVHRIGRTGRAGAQGHAVSLLSADEFKQLHAIELLLKQKIERIDVDDFEPQHSIPTTLPSTTNSQPSKSNQSKKNTYSKRGHSTHTTKHSNTSVRTGSIKNKSRSNTKQS